MGVTYNPRIVTDGLVLALDVANSKSYDSRPRGQQTYTSSGTHSWTCPSGVTSVSVVCIGGGGGGNGGGNGVGGAGGGGGGGLGYKNNISVTPGQSYTVVVGGGGAGDYWDGPPFSENPADNGGDSYFIDATTVKGGGGGRGYGNSYFTGGSGGTYVGDGGGNGNSGGTGSGSGSGTGYLPATGGGGGSTGTYTGNATTRGTSKYITSNCTSGCLAGSGTGQGLLGDGSSGSYGAGGGANMNTFSNGASGSTGAVRIMWGPDRSYPSTGVADQTGSTAFNDMSGNGNTGTLVNEPTYSSANGGSLVFDGDNNHVSIPYNASLKPATAITMEAFCYIQNNGTSWTSLIQYPINSSSHTSPYFEWAIYLNMSLRALHTRIDGEGVSSPDNVWNFNEWVYVAITFENQSVKYYVNGASVGSSSVTKTSITYDANNPVYIGKNASGNEPFEGKLGSMRVYNKALTASEVKQNFNALRGRFGI